MVCIFFFSTQLVNCCLHGRRNYMVLVYCCPCTVPSLWPPPPSPPSQSTVYSDSVWLWGVGWGVLKCTVDHILQEFYTLFLTRFRTYKIALPPQTKMTSKEDFKRLVSLISYVHGRWDLISLLRVPSFPFLLPSPLMRITTREWEPCTG